MFQRDFLKNSVNVNAGLDGRNAVLNLKIDIVALVDLVTDLIPGDLDDKMLDSLAEALLAKKTANKATGENPTT